MEETLATKVIQQRRRMQATPTQHPQQVFCPVHLAHLLLAPQNNMSACDVFFANGRILGTFEAVQEIGAEGTVKVAGEPRDNRRQHQSGFAKASGHERRDKRGRKGLPSRLGVELEHVLLPLFQQFLHGG